MHVVPTIRGVVRALGLVAILFLGVCAAEAAPVYDGSAPMQCAIKSVMVCDDPSICVRGTAQTVSLPSVLSVDVGRRLVGGDASGRTVRITAVGHGARRLMLHGEDPDLGGVAWNVVILGNSCGMWGGRLSSGGWLLMFRTGPDAHG